MEISRSLGCEPIGFDVQTVKFSSKHTFEVAETVLISRTTRGWSYGQITEKVEAKECVFDSKHKHGMAMWKVTYYNNMSKQMYKVLPSSLVGKLQSFSSVPPSSSPSIPVLTSPPTAEEARTLMGKAPSAGQVAMSLFVSNKVLTRHELVLVPRSSGGFSFGIIDSQVSDFPCPSSEGQAGGFLTRGCRVLVGEKANKVVSPSNIGKLLFHLPSSSPSSSSSSGAKEEKVPVVEEEEEEFLIDEDVMSALTANFADLDPDHEDNDDLDGFIDPATAGDELEGEEEEEKEEEEEDDEQEEQQGQGGSHAGPKKERKKQHQPHQQHTHYQAGGHKRRPHVNASAHPTGHHGGRGGRGGRGGLVFRPPIRPQTHETTDIPLGSLLLDQIDNRLKAPPSRRIVIDGPNVAFLEGSGHHKFYSASRVINCVDFWRKLGHTTTVIFPAQYFYDDTNRFGNEGFSALLPLINDGTLTQTPFGEYDDSYTIKFAMKNDAYIVSNDMFRDFSANIRIKDKDTIRKIELWIRHHRISFTIMDSQFVPRPEFSFPST
eukprot:TRINITY_DN3233_c2_g1_i1.p1 TRINITY_DN3233_c2_g1~~TRINITY_DN3233_c2_g1_i1.p1  ORF type:complete len:546 (-),score=239.43 TRINITY_DN3233_c2_g1_i1:55-1692(-)